MHTKPKLRAMFLEEESWTYNSDNIISSVTQLLSALNYKTIGVYLPIKGEVNINTLFKTFSNKVIALPHIIDRSSEMFFTAYQLFDNLKISKFGCLQTIDNNIVVPEIILIPGLAFDEQGNRLGRGKGCYDRYLSIHKNVIKVGICPHDRLLNSIPSERHDIKMDYIITDELTLSLC